MRPHTDRQTIREIGQIRAKKDEPLVWGSSCGDNYDSERQ